MDKTVDKSRLPPWLPEAVTGISSWDYRGYLVVPVSSLFEILFFFFSFNPGSKKKPLHLISSSDKPGLDLLKVEYIKVRVIECLYIYFNTLSYPLGGKRWE